MILFGPAAFECVASVLFCHREPRHGFASQASP
jgi:hypothetical protein